MNRVFGRAILIGSVIFLAPAAEAGRPRPFPPDWIVAPAHAQNTTALHLQVATLYHPATAQCFVVVASPDGGLAMSATIGAEACNGTIR